MFRVVMCLKLLTRLHGDHSKPKETIALPKLPSVSLFFLSLFNYFVLPTQAKASGAVLRADLFPSYRLLYWVAFCGHTANHARQELLIAIAVFEDKNEC